MPGFKDILNLIAGELFSNNGYSPNILVGNLQMMICMITANPFIG